MCPIIRAEVAGPNAIEKRADRLKFPFLRLANDTDMASVQIVGTACRARFPRARSFASLSSLTLGAFTVHLLEVTIKIGM